MISLFICIHFIHEFVENIQETNDVSSQSKSLNVADKYVVLETPQKDKKMFKNAHPLQQSQS